MKRLLLLNIFFSFCGCDPNVELENIKPESLVSVTCFISPQDTILTAYVIKASAIGSTVRMDSATVKDATVTISDGVSHDTLYLTSEVDPNVQRIEYKYSAKRKHIAITDNSIFTLDVKVPPSVHLSATCTIPPPPDIANIEGDRSDDDYLFSIEWDNSSKHKFFMLVLEADGNYPNPSPGEVGTIDLKPELVHELKFPSDKQSIQNKYDGIITNAFQANKPILRVLIKNIDENTYKYFSTYQQYEAWNSNNSGNIFPNFKDVPLIHSNIAGGVGIFGGYNQSSSEIAP